VWTIPRRYRLMKLRVGDTLSAKRGDLTITGTVSRVEAEGFWIDSPDGMSYRFTLSACGSARSAAYAALTCSRNRCRRRAPTASSRRASIGFPSVRANARIPKLARQVAPNPFLTASC